MPDIQDCATYKFCPQCGGRLEKRLIGQPGVLKAVNWLRARVGHPPPATVARVKMDHRRARVVTAYGLADDFVGLLRQGRVRLSMRGLDAA